MRNTVLVLILALIALGCRSSEEAPGGDTAAAARGESALEADRTDPHERIDEAERWERKVIGEVTRAEARRDAARERSRRIDEEPIEHPPAPPVEEPPR